MADESAWSELAELYLSLLMLKQASYCYEELILATPQNHHLYERYAEIMYSLGGDNIRVARKYFALSIELNPESVRSLWGLYLCISLSKPESKGKSQSKDQKLIEWVSKKINNIYQSQNPTMLPIVGATLKSFKPKNE
eukprot:TRINITY_DN5569_c0_g1_i2.p1 TRINITY_DN5569_c0_g1~~TRINITY_DN5569_c0_g1_i2.p1  ORF type:complete len:138 (+),score=24.07 TRINITY_DN5569_c0_g1_i2:190-603(+)